MKISEILRQEHELIEKGIGILSRGLGLILQGRDLPPNFLENLLCFFNEYVFNYHFQKEEEILFPKMEEAGVFRENLPLEEMMQDHRLARKYMDNIKYHLSRYRVQGHDEKARIRESLTLFIKLMARHSRREDRALYPMGDRLLSDKSTEKVIESYREMELKNNALIGKYKSVLEKYEEKISGIMQGKDEEGELEGEDDNIGEIPPVCAL